MPDHWNIGSRVMAHPGIKSDEGGCHACCHVRFEVRKRIKGHGASQKLAFIFDFFRRMSKLLHWHCQMFGLSCFLLQAQNWQGQGLLLLCNFCCQETIFVTMADCTKKQDMSVRPCPVRPMFEQKLLHVLQCLYEFVSAGRFVRPCTAATWHSAQALVGILSMC